MSDSRANSGDTEAHVPQFLTTWEGDLSLDDHEAVTAMLSRSFPSSSQWYQGARSWAGMQPELRIIARSGDVIVAHAGLRRMFVRVGETDLCVTAVGMVAVSPILQGTGLGGQLLRLVDATLPTLGGHFGLLEAGEGVQSFYRRHGWEPLAGVTGHYNDFTADGASTLVSSHEGWLVRPSASPLAEWPRGDIHWNGQMV